MLFWNLLKMVSHITHSYVHTAVNNANILLIYTTFPVITGDLDSAEKSSD